MKISELESFLNDYLEVYKFNDYCPNGLQVEANPNVSKIITSVSASLSLFQKAKKEKADAVLVHHGLFWGNKPLPLTKVLGKRVAFLYENKINLLAYHLPLDAHMVVGNNAAIADILGLEQVELFAKHGGSEIGTIGNLVKYANIKHIKDKLLSSFNQITHCYLFGKKKIKKIAIVSGGAASDVYQAKEKGADLFITGEVSEPLQEWCKEANMNFIAIGHYMSEQEGVKRLSKIIDKKFGLKSKFIAVKNIV